MNDLKVMKITQKDFLSQINHVKYDKFDIHGGLVYTAYYYLPAIHLFDCGFFRILNFHETKSSFVDQDAFLKLVESRKENFKEIILFKFI